LGKKKEKKEKEKYLDIPTFLRKQMKYLGIPQYSL
jgi:hypothetical protein